MASEHVPVRSQLHVHDGLFRNARSGPVRSSHLALVCHPGKVTNLINPAACAPNVWQRACGPHTPARSG